MVPFSASLKSGFNLLSGTEKFTPPPGYYDPRQYREPEQDFFDFSQLLSPVPTTSTITRSFNNSIDDDLQTPAKPSHEYELSKQHNLPAGSIAGLSTGLNSGFDFLSSNVEDIDKVSNVAKIDSMRHQQLRHRHTFALQDRNSPYNAEARPGVSSYWSITEQQAFSQQIKRFGTNWIRIAEEMVTKNAHHEQKLLRTAARVRSKRPRGLGQGSR
ncbi:hypothetical protein BKA63DRAFT_4876 [Paraphoma chrysanthemicola]|nr:hypothetical protein BKA63DRAFT_4876 [Paraphoma chrysanthemicola]